MLFLSKDKEFTDLIIKLNTRSQLFDQGIDSDGERLDSKRGRGYSKNTINGTLFYEGKISKGLPYDRITLYDTGDFYKSFKVVLRGNDLLTTSNPIKDGVNLLTQWGQDIIGLTDENLDIVVKMAREKILAMVQNHLFNAA